MKTAIAHCTLYTGRDYYQDGLVLIENGAITYAGAAIPFSADEVINARGGICMPGLVNAHTHIAMSLMRGVGAGLPLMDWLQVIFPIEDRLTDERVYWGSMLSIMEMIRRGTTAFADMYFFMPAVARAVLETGMRANLVRSLTGMEKLPEAEAFFREFNGAGEGRVRVYYSPHAEYTTTPELNRAIIERARRDQTGIHVHISETRSEVEGCRERHGVSPVRYYESLGAFEGPCIAAHCVHVSEEDIAILAARHVNVAHCPGSNLKLASGFAPTPRMLAAGVNVAIGNDGPCSNNSLNMFSEMRLAACAAKAAWQDSADIPARQAIQMAGENGARALGFANVGRLEAGMRADLVLLDPEAENLHPCFDIEETIAYAAEGLNVCLTMVDGKALYRDGEFLTLDAERVRANFDRCSKELVGGK